VVEKLIVISYRFSGFSAIVFLIEDFTRYQKFVESGLAEDDVDFSCVGIALKGDLK
jgi:hypothetical protein